MILHDILHYNPETGEWTWLVKPSAPTDAGARAGCAHINSRGKRYHLGFFLTKEEAGAAYSTAASHHFGEFAHPAVQPPNGGFTL